MILLDTNIISELWRPQPTRFVEQWMDAQPATTLYLSAMTLGELRYGAMRLSESKRQDAYMKAIDRLESQSFDGRILAFDRHCCAAYGNIRATREKLGRPILSADAVIAAIAKTNGLQLATRNVKDFEGLGIELINPFETLFKHPARP